jgi:hypothetical protein
MPEEDKTTLFIWGEPAAIIETKVALAHWELALRESANKERLNFWPRVNALDGRAEYREERQTQQKMMQELFRDADVDYPVEAAILWPKDLEDTDQFQDECEAALSQLRSNFDCRLAFPKSNPACVMIGTRSELDVHAIMTRLTNMIKETISRRQALCKINVVHMPDHDIYRDRVGLLDKDPKSGSYLPTLHGKEAVDQEELANECRQTHLANRKRIKKGIDVAIKRLRIPQQHVRFRFVFGEIGFVLFHRPNDKSETYTYDEFTTMVTQERNALVLNGLPVRRGKITDLPDVLSDMEAFSDPEEYYSAFLDFAGQTHNSKLRLETVFYPSGDDETESREKRWVEITSGVARLQISSLNFERPDFQATIDSFPLYNSKLIRGSQASFQKNIMMDRPMEGIRSMPRRRVKYPRAGLDRLQTVSELIMTKWRYKNGDGVFELRRKDVYDVRPGLAGGTPVRTDWHALYYYPEWDNLTSEFASVKPGEDVTWDKSAATFFPESASKWDPLPKGFKNFINEVEEIQDLLAKAIYCVENGGKPRIVDGFLPHGGESDDAYGPD